MSSSRSVGFAESTSSSTGNASGTGPGRPGISGVPSSGRLVRQLSSDVALDTPAHSGGLGGTLPGLVGAMNTLQEIFNPFNPRSSANERPLDAPAASARARLQALSRERSGSADLEGRPLAPIDIGTVASRIRRTHNRSASASIAFLSPQLGSELSELASPEPMHHHGGAPPWIAVAPIPTASAAALTGAAASESPHSLSSLPPTPTPAESHSDPNNSTNGLAPRRSFSATPATTSMTATTNAVPPPLDPYSHRIAAAVNTNSTDFTLDMPTTDTPTSTAAAAATTMTTATTTTTTNGTAVDSAPPDELFTVDDGPSTRVEFQAFLRWLERSFPFLVMLLTVFTYRHKEGIALTLVMWIVLLNANSLLTSQVAAREHRRKRVLIFVMALLACQLASVYYIFPIYKSLALFPPSTHVEFF